MTEEKDDNNIQNKVDQQFSKEGVDMSQNNGVEADGGEPRVVVYFFQPDF